MPERMQYGEIRERIRQIFATPDESCTPEMLQHCCLLIAVMALGTEAVLLDQTSAPKRSDLEAILQNLRQLCSEEIRLVRVEWQRHEKEALQHGLPDDIAREEVEATLYRDLCGMLPITAPLPVMPPDDSMTANAFLAVFPGAGWLTSEEVADRLGQAKYGRSLAAGFPSHEDHLYPAADTPPDDNRIPTGLSCIRVARFRPPNKILAISPIEHTVRMLALVWGVIPIHGEQAGSLEDRFDGAVKAAREAGYLKDGDEVILTGGTAGSVPGSTNVVEVSTVGEDV